MDRPQSDRPQTGGIYKNIDGKPVRVDEDGFPIRLAADGTPVLDRDGQYVRLPQAATVTAPPAPAGTDGAAKGTRGAAKAEVAKPEAGKSDTKSA